jgi:hypothetical protein
LLAETGLVGFLSWLVLWVVWPLWATTRWPRGNLLALAVLGAGLSNLLDTPWLVPGMGTVSVMLIVMACGGRDERSV